MGASEIRIGEFLYEATAKFTDVVEYGVSLEAVLSGAVSLPPSGARFDVHLKGSVRGPKLNGKFVGVDYLSMRADGRAHLHIHAQITTEDGQNIAFFADGVVFPQEGSPFWQLRENVSFLTGSPAYAWVNTLQGWGLGTVNPSTGDIAVKIHAS